MRLRLPAAARVSVLALLALSVALQAAAQDSLAFIGVALDRETRDADRRLAQYLYQHAGVRLTPEDLEYERVVDRMVSWRPQDGFFLTRATPYVYLAAEMLGAELDVLGTYVSASSGQTTYSSYFVVNRAAFAAPPTLFELERFLREGGKRRRFVYHNQFSTSSYFLPSLFFRARKIFNMEESSESLAAIASERVDGSSSTLVELVARGEADVAAVWDATKRRFENGEALQQYGSKVYFVQLPTMLPNDLLVCSAAIPRETRDRLRTTLRNMRPDEIGVADFGSWKVINEAPQARLALADLRWLARERTAPVTVQIRPVPSAEGTAAGASLVEAARQAIRLAGTELVVFDEDFHEHVDFVWTLEPVHDGAAVLRSAIPGSDVPEQVLRLSFRDVEDLSKRLVNAIVTRLHRVRYVWPFSSATPIVMRDTALTLRAGSLVKVQKVTWLDPQRNRFRAGAVFDARIRAAGFYRYELDPSDFQRAGAAMAGPDAMTNVSYRVILVRPEEERPLFRALTAGLVALLGAAALAAAWDLYRARARARPPATTRQWV